MAGGSPGLGILITMPSESRGRVGVQSFVVEDARRFSELLPEVPVRGAGRGAADRRRAGGAQRVGGRREPAAQVTDQALVDRVHALGMGVNVWTVDEPGAMRAMPGLGVDGVITDYPQCLTRRRPPPVRLS
ncbi:hypothetical protein GCM10010182_62690 [Actinomadura cremea]|nr:hypothetical protein GCM10010182_62690 [Actinomadura cremea]